MLRWYALSNNNSANNNPVPGDQSQDRPYLPFASTSIWRLSTAASPAFADDSDPRNVTMHDVVGDANGYGQVWVNDTNHSHPISFASNSDPLATMTDTIHTSPAGIPPGGSWQERIPTDARIADGDDKHMHIITPDKTTVLEHFYVQKQTNTQYTCTRRHAVALDGPGIGPQSGTRAYGGSAIGGLIRAWEVDPTDPRYTGKIQHALAIALRSDQLYFDSARWAAEPLDSGSKQRYGYLSSGDLSEKPRPGWPASTPAAGFMWQPGYVWPASEQDYDSPSSYSGTIPMGSYFAIPDNIDIAALGLTPAGFMLAKAAQDYGLYVTDRAGATAFYVENTPSGSSARTWVSQLIDSGGQYKCRDIRTVLMASKLVTSNSSTSPNGGILGGARRAA